MGIFNVLYDLVTQTEKLVAYPGFTDVVFTNVASPTTDFNVGFDIDADHKIDVQIAGRWQIENVNYTIDDSNNKVVLEAAVSGVDVVLRVYLK